MWMLAVASVSLSAPANGSQVSATWSNATGNWNDSTQWTSNPYYPNNGTPAGATYVANLGGSNSYTVNLTTPITLDQLNETNYNSTIKIDLAGGSIAAPVLNVGGTLKFFDGTAASLDNTNLSLPGSSSGFFGSYLQTSSSSTTLTLGAHANVHGGGASAIQAQFGGYGSLVNNGVINADHTNNGSLSVNNFTSFTNNGTLEATSGATLIVQPNSFTNHGIIKLAGNGTFRPTSSGFNVNDGTLEGYGTVNGPVSFTSQSTLAFVLGGSIKGAGYDSITVGSDYNPVALNGTLNISFSNGYQDLVKPTDTFTVFNDPYGLSGVFSNVANGSRVNTSDGLGSFLVTYGGSSKSVVLSNFQPVPEPASISLFVMAGLALGRRRRSC